MPENARGESFTESGLLFVLKYSPQSRVLVRARELNREKRSLLIKLVQIVRQMPCFSRIAN